MSLPGTILDFTAGWLRLRAPQRPAGSGTPRILVIRRNRMGDMILTLPLLHALRRHFPGAHISVACDPAGAPIAQNCEAVNDIIVLVSGWSRWLSAFRNARALQNYDYVLAAKGGFDRRLAVLARLTNAPVRVGFEKSFGAGLLYYTNPIPLPPEPNEEHQVETQFRLLKPLGIVKPSAVNLSLRVPESSREFAAEIRAKPPFSETPGYMLINFSSTVKLKFREEDFIALTRRILGATNLAVGLVAAPMQQQLANEIAMCMASKRVTAVDTPNVMDLAALMEKALMIFTPEGGAAHLAASMNTPALVLWSEGPFKKWHSRGHRHVYIHAGPQEEFVPLERVWDAMQPMLNAREDNTSRIADDIFREPQPPELRS